MRRVRIGVFAGVIALTGVVVTAAPGAHAATATCGSACVALASQAFGESDVSAVQVTIVGRHIEIGPDIVLGEAGPDSIEDFWLEPVGTVTEFYDAGLIGPAVGLTWPTAEVYEYQYDPEGDLSGDCLGTVSTAESGTGISLQPCGLSADTCWVPDSAYAGKGFEPLIAASETSASDPEVLSEDGVDKQLTTSPLVYEGLYGFVLPGQMWENVSGVL